MALIETHNLSKQYRTADKAPTLAGTIRHFLRRRYRTVEAVKDVSFSIERGEMVGFLGPNGAGKTTCLKMLTGLICPTSGTASVAGHTPFRREHPFLRQITLVMGQKQQLIWDLPPADSFRINAAVYELSDDVLKTRVGELAEMLSLSTQLSQPVRKLSLGERMKAELLAALLHRPDVLFLDEPTLGLDVNAQAAVREFLRDYNRRFGATVLLTSHYMADITALCQRILLIHKGQVIYDGALDRIVQRFAPYREVKIELANVEGQADFTRYGEVLAQDGRVVTLMIQRRNLTETVATLMRELELADLTITDPPVEQIIGRIFTKGNAA
ncbi:MAG: ABC transporter [Lentisphaerae bacterium RIFOXYB12_FULL_65_16]|nr:MAG: ABC transporter [Lentisphaerae bacterium RIFOXYA12_64_32]OGV92153.1 MAG: ABC transporter [Lentisphaerae bacterium RIFOXYB12_FULL_65_16]